MADAPTVLLDAAIAAVTVYTDSARVTRRGTASVPTGEATLVVAGLPEVLQPDSMRVSVFAAGVRVGGVDLAMTYEHASAPADLERRLDALRDERTLLNDQLDVVEARLEALATMRDTGSRTAGRALVTGRGGPDAVDTLIDAVAERMGAAQEQRRRLRARSRDVQRELDTIEAEVTERRDTGVTRRYEARIAVTSAEATEADVELAVVVKGAGWSPGYDARVSSDGVRLTYHAFVRQHTGEDWNDVALTLSTARPGRTVTIPEPGPWVVGAYEPPVYAAGAPAPMQSAAADMRTKAAALRTAAPAQVETAVAEQGAVSARFRVTAPITVPADGSPHKARIGEIDLDADLDYVTVPAFAEEAYLRAKITNTSDLVLLPGPVSAFHGDELTGTTRMDVLPPGADTELQLGVDDRIEVERKLIRRESGRGRLGPGHTAVGYETTIANRLPTPTKVSVVDRVPIAGRDDVKVKVDVLKPEPAERTDLGLCTWPFELPPGGQVTVTVGATIEHPRGMRISGLDAAF